MLFCQQMSFWVPQGGPQAHDERRRKSKGKNRSALQWLYGSQSKGVIPQVLIPSLYLTYIYLYIRMHVYCMYYVYIYIYTLGSIQYSILIHAFSAGLDIGDALIFYPTIPNYFISLKRSFALVCIDYYRSHLCPRGILYAYIYQQYLGLMRSGDKQMLRHKIIFILCFLCIKRFPFFFY